MHRSLENGGRRKKRHEINISSAARTSILSQRKRSQSGNYLLLHHFRMLGTVCIRSQQIMMNENDDDIRFGLTNWTSVKCKLYFDQMGTIAVCIVLNRFGTRKMGNTKYTTAGYGIYALLISIHNSFPFSRLQIPWQRIWEMNIFIDCLCCCCKINAHTFGKIQDPIVPDGGMINFILLFRIIE